MDGVVWAKLRYCPYWPARIVEPPQHLSKPPRKFCVFFFGSNNYGFVEIGSTLSYLEHKEKYIKKGRGKKFALAVSECEQHIANPTNFEPDTKNVIVVKEFDFMVKKEPESDDADWYEAVNICTECSKRDAAIDQLKKELESKTQKVFELEDTMERMKNVHEIEVQEMKLKLKQSNNNDDFYEVECLLDHKQVGAKQKFLVKWEGYDDSHNTWVERKDLYCKNILQKYLKSNNLN